MPNLLKVNDLSVSFYSPQGELEAVRNVSFSLNEGETLALVGESGCGKSVLCKSLMGLLHSGAVIKNGEILLQGRNIVGMSEAQLCKLRGREISMVFQDPMTSLNPTLTIEKQVAEAVRIHNPGLSRAEIHDRVIQLLESVGIGQASELCKLYPASFSGGMRQRVVIAIALAGNPKILLADEPTTALDVTIQAQILDVLKDVQKKLGLSIILVSHDLGVVAKVADRVAIMYAGKIVEIGMADEVYYDPRHPYTWGLLRTLPALSDGKHELYTIPGAPPTGINLPKGDAFAPRNPFALPIDFEKEPPMFRISDTHYAATWLLDKGAPDISLNSLDSIVSRHEELMHHKSHKRTVKDENILEVEHLSHRFKIRRGVYVNAVRDVSFNIRAGEIFGLVGESGSGKSTVASCIMNIYHPLKGSVRFKGIDIFNPKEASKNKDILKTKRQLIFQDSSSSLNQRMTIEDIISEPMVINRIKPERGSLKAEAEYQMQYVGLDASYAKRYPPELSGGQRQRVAIARAVSMDAELLVADEPVASLDASIQAQVINLFRHLRDEHGCAILFIAHDLAMVKYLCDRVGVMYRGKLVEIGDTAEVFNNPQHEYTKSLLAAIPKPDPRSERQKEIHIYRGETHECE